MLPSSAPDRADWPVPSNLIYTAVRDAELAMNHIAVSLDRD
jgi:hypothetical protein